MTAGRISTTTRGTREVLRFPNAAGAAPPAAAARRRALVVLGFSISVSVRAELGLAPWDVFHQGVAKVAHLSFGVVVVLVGLVVLLAWIPLRQRLGLGTVINTLSVGFIANLGLALIPDQHALAMRIASPRARDRRAWASAAASTSAPGSGPGPATA